MQTNRIDIKEEKEEGIVNEDNFQDRKGKKIKVDCVKEEKLNKINLNWTGLGEENLSKNISFHNSRRGRKNKKSDMVAKLEKSRQSARECRARKKLRYQYLEDLVQKSEIAINTLKKELEMYLEWCKMVDDGADPSEASMVMEEKRQRILATQLKSNFKE